VRSAAVRGFSLSIQQLRLWKIQSYSRTSVVVGQMCIEGDLDVEIFQQALQQLVDRHTLLRTRFARVVGMDIPIQVIDEEKDVTCPLVDVAAMSPSAQEQHIQICLDTLTLAPADIEEEDALRCVLLRLKDAHYVFLLRLAPLCADATTLKLLVSELAQLYRAYLRGEELPEEPLQYIDVSAWQDGLLAEEEATEHANFWQRIDLSSLATQRLPFARTSQQELQPYVVTQRFQLTSSIPSPLQLQGTLQRTGVSLEALVLASWLAAIWRCTDQEATLMGVVCDGRYHEELATTPGLYSRVLPMNISLTGKQSLEKVMLLVQSFLDEAKREHIYFPWELETTQAGQTRPRLFPVTFAYEDWPASLPAGDIVFSLEQSISCLEPCGLHLQVVHTGQALQCTLHFDEQRFSFAQIQRLGNILSIFLATSSSTPQALIETVPLLSPQEQERVLQGLRSPAPIVPFSSLIQAFEAQVERFPEQMAVVGEDEQLNYRELNNRANRLAHVLLDASVQPNVLVGLYVERSAHMLVGLLAVLKAGGAYVPLDIDQPTARLASLLDDLHMPVLLTQTHLQAKLAASTCRVFCLDAPETWGGTGNESNLRHVSDPDQLAYIMYTSGSTGKPKGVMIRQGSIANYTFALCELLALEPGLHFATVSALAADLGNTSIFCSLASGGCLHIPGYATVTSGEAFADYARQHTLDVLKIVPSHLTALLASSGGRAILPHRYLILGGEVFSYSLLRQLELQEGSCCVLNHYGPTETTIGALVNVLGKPGTETRAYALGTSEAATIPVGKPLAGMSAVVLDRFGHLVPSGMTGELYIGGAGLALGYWQQPEQTAQRFIVRAGERLYRTGDLVRYDELGCLEFMGRADAQVKLRGYRIELTEIEIVLSRHPGVRENVVVLREDQPGEPRLVAYVVAHHPLPEAEELRQFLAAQIPAYMVPAHFLFLRALPLNANGKVDWRQLPVPENTLQQRNFVAPQTPLQEIVAGIWQTVLHVKSIGIHDNFASSGGHSLLATQIVSRLRQALQLDVPLRTLFESPTVAGLSERIEAMQRSDKTHVLPVPVAIPRTANIPLSFAQERLWFLHQLKPESTAYHIPLAVSLTGKLHFSALWLSFDAIMRRHESLRTTFQAVDGVPQQIIQPVPAFALPLIDLSGLSDQIQQDCARRLAEQELHTIFDLAQGPLLRVWLLRINKDTHVLSLTMHHIISDAWSRTIFLQELTTCYNAYVQDVPPTLPELPLQYADFANWQRDWLQQGVLQIQLDYWIKQLSNVPTLDLPTDYPRPALQTFNGAYEVHVLPESLSAALKQLSQHEGTTLFMTLLGAFQLLLACYSDQHDIVVGTPIANRSWTEVEGLIGFFSNTLLIRTDLSGNPTFREVLARVREVTLQAYAHQDVPFEKLVEVLRPVRDMSRSPLFQVLFMVQHATPGDEGLHGLTGESFTQELSTAKFDLTCSVIDTGKDLHCSVEYNTDLFTAQTIRLLCERWHALLTALVQNPELPVDTLSLVSDEERTRVQTVWNATDDNEIQAVCLHTLFEEQAVRSPDAVAVASATEQLTYALLDCQANQLAQYLYSLGVRPDTVVGVCIERSPLLAVCILGILKAGGAYLPLDPIYPQERLAFMLQDAHATVLLTQSHLETLLPISQARVVHIDKDWPAIAHRESTSPASGVGAEHLLYVIYTSGSTGTPKGIAMPHRALAHLIQWQRRHSQAGLGTRTLQFTSLSFDVACQELFSTWDTGGCLVLATPEQRYSMSSMLAWLAEAAVERLFLPFIALQQLALAATMQPEWSAPLREVITAGEQLQATMPLRQFFARLPGCRCYNQYGPAESHVVTAHQLAPQPDQWPLLPPIGTPIANTRMYLLTEQLQLAAIGLIAEIYIAGAAQARGYAYRPDLTAEKFLPDPFSSSPGGRLYRTGDLARYLPDGSIQFLGRRDQQVKLRGYRIEIGEIEEQLSRHEYIGAVAVTIYEPANGEKRLVAYVVPRGGKAVSGEELRRYLQRSLPEYMLPTIFVKVESLPLTPSGKVNRSALQPPEVGTLLERGTTYQAPQTEIERVIAEVWQEVLTVEKVGLLDNFFDLGGHSLLATRVQHQLQERLQQKIALVDLFTYSTVSALAQYVSRGQEEQQLALSSIQQRTAMRREQAKWQQERRKTRPTRS